ncbi:hypothetical protein K491DRAFT_25984 [Lophiostoma macrostomum CBS 122681]|uniref:Uncharacterized protein n=1 Tax=Lophiostoma macrostomum CBS 122681 TaxID=1314788 RepID=A0A6A6T369_9PLEO|nr:hypothetical protein K491DRAFT_25984 [Lophiostoma macrostomum CBS 122681]
MMMRALGMKMVVPRLRVSTRREEWEALADSALGPTFPVKCYLTMMRRPRSFQLRHHHPTTRSILLVLSLAMWLHSAVFSSKSSDVAGAQFATSGYEMMLLQPRFGAVHQFPLILVSSVLSTM